MNSNKPSEKCIAYLKINGWKFDRISHFGDHIFIKNNNELTWYGTMYKQWFVYGRTNTPLGIKLNEIQKT